METSSKMIVFNHEHIIETHAMVFSAAGSHSGFFQKPQPRRGLARIEYHGLGSANGFHISASDRGDAGESLNEVQRRAFGSENRGSRTLNSENNVPFGKGKAI